MKLIHISDLHLGKRLHNFSLVNDQREILTQISHIVQLNSADAVVIAGDIYDKSVPSAEAVTLFDDFLNDLVQARCPIFIISGNHDSAERIAFGARLMKHSGVHLSPVYDRDTVKPIVIPNPDGFGDVHFYLLPFIRPCDVRRLYPEEKIENYNDAVRIAVEHLDIDTSCRNICVAHQFVSGAEVCDSEEHSVGGLDMISASVFSTFDYTALGHIHGQQTLCNGTIRYSGTPLKYSFSEEHHKKSVTIVELAEKGTTPVVSVVPLKPLHDMRTLKGRFEELMDGEPSEDYLHITLSNKDMIPNAIEKLRTRYPNIMELEYEREDSDIHIDESTVSQVRTMRPMEIFDAFFRDMYHEEMNDEQSRLVRELIEEIWEGKE